MIMPNVTAPSPAVFVLCGCQILEMNAAPAAPPT
jgi:hypothetical protein